ncbi:MAG: hypothetical protein QF441_03065 [Bacteriovoracaceae bacterium]|nr:hypothetical protein [Halobacteriovoraceae bacterium]MDP7319557.1 hypothetical protein [Bacteriovoracaceae bacterium]
MIIVDRNSGISQWLQSFELNETGQVKVDLETLEVASGFDTELVMIHLEEYAQMNELQQLKLSQVGAILIYNPENKIIDHYLDKVIGVISEKTSTALVKNQIVYFEKMLRQSAMLKSQLLTLNHELLNTMSGVESQLLRVKKVYEEKSPKRLEEFKGVSAYSKYAAGEDIGGEFFDIFSFENKIFILMSSSSSYLISSSLLDLFSKLKQKQEISGELEEWFISEMKKQVTHLNENKNKPIDFSLLTCIIDLNTLKVEGHNFGHFQFLSSQFSHQISSCRSFSDSLAQASFEFTISRGERLLFNSPGFLKNWQRIKPGFVIEELISDSRIKPLDVLDEIYFQLRKESQTGFLTFDASSVILEVDENVMVQM